MHHLRPFILCAVTVMSGGCVCVDPSAVRILSGDAGPTTTVGGENDSGLPDSGEVDAGSPDAGPTDVAPDAGWTDAGWTDAGSTDAGSTDAGSTDAGSTDAGLTDAGRTDAGALLPGVVRGFDFAAPVELHDATLVGDSVLVVGTKLTPNPNDREGVIASLGDRGSASQIGGSQQEQLWAVTSRGSSVLAVGITRSFLGTSNGDEGLLVMGRIQSDGGLPQWSTNTLGLTSDLAVGLWAAAPHDTGWVVAGNVDGGTAALVVLLNADAGVRAARTVSFGAGTDYRTRAIISTPSAVILAGFYTPSVRTVGYVAGFDPVTLAPAFAFSFAGTGDVAVTGLVASGGLLRGIGRSDTGALVFSLDPASGSVTDVRTSSSIGLRAGTSSLVVGSLPTGDLGIARILGTRFEGVRFPGLGRLSFIGRAPVFASATGTRVIGMTSSRLVELGINDDLLGACSGAFGVPFADQSSAGVAPAVLTVTSTPVPLVSSIVSTTQQPLGIAASSGCGL